jgi:hypothetical protein
MIQRKTFFHRSAFLIALLTVMVLAIGLIGTVYAAKPESGGNIQLVAYGVQMDKDGNLVGLGWARGNSDKGWVEGAWQPVILRIPNAQTEYGVDLVNLPDFYIGFDFYNQAGKKQGVYCDLVRSIAIGYTDLNDGSHEDWGWPQSDGTPYSTLNMTGVRTAQLAAGEYAFTNFTLAKDVGLNYSTQVNLPLTANPSELGTPPGTTTDAKHQFVVNATQIRDALSLQGQLDTDFICIYFQLHLARTFVWSNALETQYATNNATKTYGGWLYGMPPDDDIFKGYMTGGSAAYPGSAAHAYLNTAGEGQKTCQLPIPPFPTGLIDGNKFNDLDNDGKPWEKADGEPGIEGWRIYLAGVDPEGILFSTNVTTDADGFYEFTGLTDGDWYVAEDIKREVPDEDWWSQTYPNKDSDPVDPVATPTNVIPFIFPQSPALSLWAYLVALSESTSTIQHNVDFGNVELGCLNITKLIEKPEGMIGKLSDLADVTFNVSIDGPSDEDPDNVLFGLINGELRIDSNDDDVVDETDELGNSYCICDLVPGNYTVEEIVPPGWEPADIDGSPADVLPGVECDDPEVVTVNITNIPVPADVWVLKTGNITYTIFVENKGPSDAANVTVNDLLPGALNWSIVESPSLGTWNITGDYPFQKTLEGEIDLMPSGANVTVTVWAPIVGNSDNPLLGNNVTVTTTTPESDVDNNDASADICHPGQTCC